VDARAAWRPGFVFSGACGGLTVSGCGERWDAVADGAGVAGARGGVPGGYSWGPFWAQMGLEGHGVRDSSWCKAAVCCFAVVPPGVWALWTGAAPLPTGGAVCWHLLDAGQRPRTWWRRSSSSLEVVWSWPAGVWPVVADLGIPHRVLALWWRWLAVVVFSPE
jgi:hypothetical protein